MVLLNWSQQAKFFMGRKRFGYRQADKDGTRSYAEAQAENPDSGFYRLRHFEGMLLHERLPFYRPTNPQTEAQQAWRAIFADAMLEWQALSPVNKALWKMKGNRKKMLGHNAFLSEYLKTHLI